MMISNSHHLRKKRKYQTDKYTPSTICSNKNPPETNVINNNFYEHNIQPINHKTLQYKLRI